MNRPGTNLGRGLRFGGLVALALLFVVPSVSMGMPGEEIRAKEQLSGVRIPFIANSGQTDSAVAYYAPTFFGTVFVTRDGRIVYSLPSGKTQDTAGGLKKGGWSLTETFVGGRARPSGTDHSSTHVSYFLGNDSARWRSDLPTFEDVFLGEVWPGISLDLRAHGKNVEKLFTVKPNADPSRIRMKIVGARRLRVNESGALVMGTGLGEVTFTAPEAFQEIQGVRHPVLAAYELHGREYGIRLGEHDPKLPVLIDPLLQATYLGGGSNTLNQARGLAIHPATSDVYVAGFTLSPTFPGTTGGAQAVKSGGQDAFVGRLNADLTTLVQATYLGGSSTDQALALAIHPSTGDIYIAGQTASSNFPGTAGGAQAAHAILPDGFVARLNAALTTLDQATYLGGNGLDEALALAIHPGTGAVYVAGFTSAMDFPNTAGGAQSVKSTGEDAFVGRLNAALTTLDQATYVGGNSTDHALALSIHPTTGDVYVSGFTNSTNLPGTTGGAQPTNGGTSDAFVARLNGALTTLGQATYLGGNSDEQAQTITIHPTTGEVYVAGYTLSKNFPGTAGGAVTVNIGITAAFVARLNAALTALNQATYLGGDIDDEVHALVIHPITGEVYAAGETDSSHFPGTAGGMQAMNAGGTDVFVARLNTALTTLRQSTYFGGGSQDQAFALTIHPVTGQIYIAGDTLSTDLPGTAGGAQAVNGEGKDVFVARLTAGLAASLLTVVCPGDSLQASIDAAQPGNTISVFGSCGENILIRNEKQRITIDGGGTATIAAPSAASPAVNVRGKGILVQGFTIAGGSEGIEVNRGSNAVLNNNVIQNSSDNGVLVDELAFAVLTNNTVQNHPGAGIVVSENSTARIGFNADSETVASPNVIFNNAQGIIVANGSSARIVGNTIQNSTGDGIQVLRDSYAEISSNQIFTNGGDGIEVGENSTVQLGEDSGASIYESANASSNANSGFGIRCTNGGVADGRLGTLNGISGAKSFADPSCTDSLN